MHFLLEAFIIPFTIVLLLLIVVLLLKNIFPLGGNNNLGTIIVIAAMILFASIVLPFLPMLPLQLVVLNFIFGLSCLAIPFDKMPRDYLQTPRRWSFKNLPEFMFWFGPASAITNIISFGFLFFIICPHLSAGSQTLFVSIFRTGWFIENLWVQEMAIRALRDRHLPFIKQHATSAVIMVSFVAGIIGTAISYTATGQILQFTALPSEYLILVFALMIFYLLLTSLIKLIYLKHKKFLI